MFSPPTYQTRSSQCAIYIEKSNQIGGASVGSIHDEVAKEYDREADGSQKCRAGKTCLEEGIDLLLDRSFSTL